MPTILSRLQSVLKLYWSVYVPCGPTDNKAAWFSVLACLLHEIKHSEFQKSTNCHCVTRKKDHGYDEAMIISAFSRAFISYAANNKLYWTHPLITPRQSFYISTVSEFMWKKQLDGKYSRSDKSIEWAMYWLDISIVLKCQRFVSPFRSIHKIKNYFACILPKWNT